MFTSKNLILIFKHSYPKLRVTEKEYGAYFWNKKPIFHIKQYNIVMEPSPIIQSTIEKKTNTF